ncbi:MAG: FkbM family methyltransferase [Gemmatimonadota bacterium]|nr:FkbM family methyltransferase [Gemmatimonadota bacterium]
MSTTITCNVRDLTIVIDVDADGECEDSRNHELWRANSFNEKEPDTLDWIDTWFRPGETIYDVGANIGQYSLYAARRLDGQAQILAFEPEALNHAKLNRNILLNGLGEVVTAYPIAISDRTAIQHFYSKTFAPGAALHALGEPVTQGAVPFAPQNRQGTAAVSLDDLTGRFGLPFPNHVKVDVDGIEDKIVAGASRTLEDERLKTVLIEVYMFEDMAEKIETAFFKRGFALANVIPVDYTEGIVQNLIFSREATTRKAT